MEVLILREEKRLFYYIQGQSPRLTVAGRVPIIRGLVEILKAWMIEASPAMTNTLCARVFRTVSFR